jgi:hypothetical protein
MVLDIARPEGQLQAFGVRDRREPLDVVQEIRRLGDGRRRCRPEPMKASTPTTGALPLVIDMTIVTRAPRAANCICGTIAVTASRLLRSSKAEGPFAR